jgi:BRCA1/BRCA2-containing complex subunit 3
MSPIKVRLSEDVYRACLSHALSTENEEIMGLLIGDIAGGDVDDKDEDTSCKVVSIVQLRILQRLDKRKDRVEIR